MAAVCILEDFEVHRDERFLKIAEELAPVLDGEEICPADIMDLPGAEKGSEGCSLEQAEQGGWKFKRDDAAVLDFGDHHVGYVTLELSSAGSHPDAPAYIYLRFAERPDELTADPSLYNGWIGKGWIQEEYVHVDTLPAKLELPRRYAFRYLLIRVIDVSAKYSLVLRRAVLKAVSAVAPIEKEELRADIQRGIHEEDPLLAEIDRIGQKTLRNCMQNVFEDGPKRDRRIWLGDFRLQARVNYETFRDYRLAKRCLYLFGGLTFNEGKLAACLFTEPYAEADDTYLFDYALLYGSVLLDYYEATKDRETLEDLYPIAVRQIEIGMSYLNSDGIIPDHSDEFWCFIDWGNGLNTQAASLAVLIYSMRYGIRLAGYMKDTERIHWLEKEMEKLKKKAVEFFWDEERQFFVSGAERQISWATQVWMILARVFPQEKNRRLILHTIEEDPEIRMVTPYMYHHYIDALIRSGEKELALSEIKRYWGGMVKDGADTFWEVYNPDNSQESPYGSPVVNSYCHAWSCTPSYFLRKFYDF